MPIIFWPTGQGAGPPGAGSCDYPAERDVRYGTGFGSGVYTGTLLLPIAGDVRSGTGYGAGGTEIYGTLRVPTASTAPPGRYSIDEALRAKILLIGDIFERIDERLYADDSAPQTPTFPYGVLTMIGSADRFRKLRGSPNKTVTVRYQVDFYSLKKSDVRTLATTISSRAADGGLDGFQDSIGSGTTGCYIQSCRIENLRHGSEPPQGAGEARIFNAGFDAVIVFNE